MDDRTPLWDDRLCRVDRLAEESGLPLDGNDFELGEWMILGSETFCGKADVCALIGRDGSRGPILVISGLLVSRNRTNS